VTLPQVPDSFYWTQEYWGAALRCRALEPLAPHLFTSRQLSLSSEADYEHLAHSVGVDQVVTVTQVHGAAVALVRRGAPVPQARPDADVLVSNSTDVAIAVRAADCVPLLMADHVTGAVAAVHAGWRGTAARAAVAAIDTMQREFGTRPADLVVAIGPSIGPCCYQVGSELVDAFAAAGHERHLIDRWFTTPASAEGFGGPSRGAAGTPRWTQLRLDVACANRDQLILAGVPAEQIFSAGLCTAEHLDVLTSFRAEKEKAGRIAGVIRCHSARSG
jgi:YfiH family protein